MPSEEPRKLAPAPEALKPGSEFERTYRRLVAFFDLSSSFSLAVATFSSPSIRAEVIARARHDGAEIGVDVVEVDISQNFSGDFVSAVKANLKASAHDHRLALMVYGIDGLIYSYRQTLETLGSRAGPTPFVAQLNFDRERIAASLSCPLVLCLEPEAYTVLLKEAVDLSQWVSARFSFEIAAPSGASPLEPVSRRDGAGTASIRAAPEPSASALAGVSGLLRELEQTPDSGDLVNSRKRLALLALLAERYAAAGDPRQSRDHNTELLEIAQRLGDRTSEVTALIGLGESYGRLGDEPRAIECFEQAVKMAHETGDRRSEGAALASLGEAYDGLGERRRAIEYHEQALGTTREIGDAYDQRGLARELRYLGNELADVGEHSRAIEYYDQALAIAREIGDRQQELNLLFNLGSAYGSLGEQRRAIEYYEQALAIAREIGNWPDEGVALASLGDAYGALGEHRRAIEYYEQDLAVAREMGNPYVEVDTLRRLSLALNALGERERALEHAEAALKILEWMDDPKAESLRKQIELWKKQ